MNPNLFIVGAARCGTTSLTKLLSTSDEIWVPRIKEPKTLAIKNHNSFMMGPGDEAAYARKPKSMNKYLEMYTSCNRKYALDASTSYLYYADEAIKNIQKISTDPKVIIILRDPVYRAFSQYQLMIREGRETLNFQDALFEEPDRIKRGWEYAWHYCSVGRYSVQTKKYNESGIRTLTLTFEELTRDTKKTVDTLNQFLETDINSKALTKENQSNIAYPSWINKIKNKRYARTIAHKLPKALKDSLKRSDPKAEQKNIDIETRRKLEEYFKDDVYQLKDQLAKQELNWSCE